MLCSEVAFLKEGRLAARGSIAELQRRLGLGDHLSLVFNSDPAALEYAGCPAYWLPGFRTPGWTWCWTGLKSAWRRSWRPSPTVVGNWPR